MICISPRMVTADGLWIADVVVAQDGLYWVTVAALRSYDGYMPVYEVVLSSAFSSIKDLRNFLEVNYSKVWRDRDFDDFCKDAPTLVMNDGEVV